MAVLRDSPDFRALFEAAPGLYLVLTPELVIVAVSDAYLAATMTVRAQVVGRGVFDVFPDNPDDVAATGASNLRASLGRVIESRRPDAMAVQKYDIRKPESAGGDFEVRYWSPLNTPVLDAHGELRYIIHAVEDVTEFVRATQRGERLAQVSEELRVHTSRMEAEVYQRAQQIQEANAALRELQGQLEARVEARTAELRAANAALREGEEKLRQSQKLEAVGRLAGGVAHDFNNLLTVILSYAQELREELDKESPAWSDVGEILHAGQRAADLTRQMLAFSRQQVLEPRVLSINEVVSRMHKLLARVIGEDITLALDLASEVGFVKVDPGQLEQVLMNLAVNARDAMPRGGRLTISTAQVELDSAHVARHPGSKTGAHVLLSMHDTGVGMDEDTLARAFEPFFTTKEQGKGTGLGLSTVLGIVQQSGGRIGVHSEPGRGTTFKIHLPVVEAEAASTSSSEPPTLLSVGDATILLAEDDAQVRAVTTGILERAGYHVVSASHPEQALVLARELAHDIDLLLTDLVMPKMSGRDLADKVLALRPKMRVLFMSGYTNDAMVLHGMLEPGRVFLQKPFTPDALVRKVCQALATRPAPQP